MTTNPCMVQEQYVDAAVISKHFSISKQRVIALAKAGKIPAVDFGSKRKYFRFRLSDVEKAMAGTQAKA